MKVLRENAPLMLAVLAIALIALMHPAMAGTDSTFDTAFTKFSGFLEGSGGKIITLISLVGGLVGLASGRFSIAQIAIPVGVGVGVGTGIPIVTSTITALI
jgi:conjugal transfer pilus assembly protein TraA